MEREKLIEYILNFIPLLHKKMFKEFPGCEITKQQMRLLGTIENDDGKPMKYYGKKLMISKPNMTTTVNKLVEEGLIRRESDEQDRRKIRLCSTTKGKEKLKEYKEIVKESMLKRIEKLSKEDVEKLNKDFEEIKHIFSKLG